MGNWRQLAYLTSLICLPLRAGVTFDRHQEMNGMGLQTGKLDSIRHYEGKFSRSYGRSLEVVKAGIMNFPEKCNNAHKEKRKLTDEHQDCRYHVEELVESHLIKDIGHSWQRMPGETERYLLGRQIYRRGSYSHYDLVQVFENQNASGQRTVTITVRMLGDAETSHYIKPAFQKDSDFVQRSETYLLTAVSGEKTTLDYTYHAETDHWLLNKEISVPQVFATIGQGMRDVVETVNAVAFKREIASHK